MNITRAADASIQAVSPALSFGTGHLQGKKLQRCEQRNLRPVHGWVKQPVATGPASGNVYTSLSKFSPNCSRRATPARWPRLCAPTDPRREERRGRQRWPFTVWGPSEGEVRPHEHSRPDLPGGRMRHRPLGLQRFRGLLGPRAREDEVRPGSVKTQLEGFTASRFRLVCLTHGRTIFAP